MKALISKVLYALVLAIFVSANVFSIGGANISIYPRTIDKGPERGYNPENGRLAFIGNDGPIHIPAVSGLEADDMSPESMSLAALDVYGPEYGLTRPSEELRLLKSNTEENGRSSFRYQQLYRGIPIFAGELIVNLNKDGDLLSLSGEASPELSLNTEPDITAEEAQTTALGAIAKYDGVDPAGLAVSEPELWIFDESLLKESIRPPELVWRMEVAAVDATQPIRELVLVNAQTGGISLHYNQVETFRGEVKKTATSQGIKKPALKKGGVPHPKAKHSNFPDYSVGDPAPALSGVIWYVTTTGNDANDCATESTPCATINGAIGKATSGDTIYVAIGTYTGGGTEVVLIDKNITLSGGWNEGFTTQSGISTVDGQNARRGIVVYQSVGSITTNLDLFLIVNGQTGGDGGGIYNLESLFLTNSLIEQNSSSYGGGIYNNGGTININNTTISNNSASLQGGGIYNKSGNVTMDNVNISENLASFGGGIDNYYGGTLILNKSTISENSASSYYGGGISNLGGSVTLNNTTVSSNSVSSYGGGIYNNGFPDKIGLVTMNNATISNNSAGSYGGGIYNGGDGDVFIMNSILGENTAPMTGFDCNGSLISNGNNIISTTGNCFITAASGDQFNLDPKLGVLLPGQGYHPILSESPAINAGNPVTCIPTDQRGAVRVGTCDIGAYEYTIPGAVTYLGYFDGSDQQSAMGIAFSKPLVVYALDSIGSPVSGVTVTFTAPLSGASGIFSDSTTRISVATSAQLS